MYIQLSYLSISKERDTCLEQSYSRDDLPNQFMSDDHDRNKMNCHASASVKSEIHALSDLIHETIYQLNLRVMIMKIK